MYVKVLNLFLLHVNRLKSRLTEELIRHAVIVPLDEEHFDLETIVFMKLAWSFFFMGVNFARFNVNMTREYGKI